MAEAPASRLFVLVEGVDDERFVARVLRPLLLSRYEVVQTWRYAQEPDEKIRAFLRSIRSMRADYLLLADADWAPCATAKKGALCQRFPHELLPERVIVVFKEIESWYLAGLSDETARRFKAKVPGSTERLTKEQFNGLVPAKFGGARIDWLVEILKTYSIEAARQRSSSFDYALKKLVGDTRP